MALIRLVEAQFRTQWETFTVQDDYLTKFLINTGVAIVSNEMADVILGFREWRAVQYNDVNDNGKLKIGYGVGDPDLEQGMIEVEAYAEFISDLRNKQRLVRKQLPINFIPQAVFDALVSLYVDTGTWRVVQANEGTYLKDQLACINKIFTD